MLTREEIAARAARELKDAATVFLDEGLPRLIANHLPEGAKVVQPGEADPVDVAVLTGSQVARNGAYVGTPLGERGAKKILLLLERHQDDDGGHRVVERCESPTGVVQQVITPLAVFDVQPEGLVLREVAQGISALDVQLKSQTPLLAADDLKVIQL